MRFATGERAEVGLCRGTRELFDGTGGGANTALLLEGASGTCEEEDWPKNPELDPVDG